MSSDLLYVGWAFVALNIQTFVCVCILFVYVNASYGHPEFRHTLQFSIRIFAYGSEDVHYKFKIFKKHFHEVTCVWVVDSQV